MKDPKRRVPKLILVALISALTALSVSLIAEESPNPGKSAADSNSQAARSQKFDQLEVMRADSKKMHVILNQMQTNLAFVTNSNDPLKHQFELETEMWQMLLNQMDRRIEDMGRRERNPAP
jgi:Spy/CpxP family protein refolding chaperone